MDSSLMREVNRSLGLVGYEIDEISRCKVSLSSSGTQMTNVTLRCSHYNNDNVVAVMALVVDDGVGGYTAFVSAGPSGMERIVPSEEKRCNIRKYTARIIATEVNKRSMEDAVIINFDRGSDLKPYVEMMYESLHEIIPQTARVQSLEIKVLQYIYTDSDAHEALIVRMEVFVPWTEETHRLIGTSYNVNGKMYGIVSAHRYDAHGSDMLQAVVQTWDESWDCSSVDEMLFRAAARACKEYLDISLV